MTYRLAEREFSAISSLPAEQRYEHFVKRVADWQAVWGLKGARGWVSAGDTTGRECMPFWPHRRYAEALATGEWADSEPTEIALADFTEKWLPGMERDGLLVAVFPTPTMKG